MENKDELIYKLEEYLEHFPGEKDRLHTFKEFLQSTENALLYTRKNFIGHITASAFILNKEKDALLLLKHKILNKWLQPGGHIDETDTFIVGAALREAAEETGIKAEELHLSTNFIFDIDSHPIPENKKKGEAAHVHHDVRYLFTCKNNNSLNYNKEEVMGGQWVKLTELTNYPEVSNVVEKINNIIA
jgi:8-oxo-dGTP pyrophosphatase MutT (NUDIX family)